ncbi:unnamed protein product [Closterium sp. Yama58-4]|nr:unnamed protein product [Closterium sp. Yama58-4]
MREGVSVDPRDGLQASQPAVNGRRKTWNRPEAIAGAVAGMATVAILHPLDIVRTRFQVNDGRDPTIPRYHGVVSAITTISRSEGMRGLYAGLYPSMVGSSLSWALYFFLYSHAKDRYTAYFSAITSSSGGNSDRQWGSSSSKSDRRHDGSSSSSSSGSRNRPSTEKNSMTISMERLSEQLGVSTVAAPDASGDRGGSSDCREDRSREGSTSRSTVVARGAAGREGELLIQVGTTGREQGGRAGSGADADVDGSGRGAVAAGEVDSSSNVRSNNESSKSSGAVEVERGGDKTWRSTLVNLAAATETGILVVLLTNPIWLAKTRLQLQGAVDPKGPHHAPPPCAVSATSAASAASTPSTQQPRPPPAACAARPSTATAVPHHHPRQYRGFHDAIWSIVKEEGFRGLYRGIGPSLILMRPNEAGQLKYRNTRDAVTSMWRLEGARGFYKGFLPNLLRVMPSASITFAVYEVMLRLLKPHPVAPPQGNY